MTCAGTHDACCWMASWQHTGTIQECHKGLVMPAAHALLTQLLQDKEVKRSYHTDVDDDDDDDDDANQDGLPVACNMILSPFHS